MRLSLWGKFRASLVLCQFDKLPHKAVADDALTKTSPTLTSMASDQLDEIGKVRNRATRLLDTPFGPGANSSSRAGDRAGLGPLAHAGATVPGAEASRVPGLPRSMGLSPKTIPLLPQYIRA